MRARALLLGLCLLPAVLRCDQGTTGADILNTPLSARASGLGGAFTALGDDLSALSYNPAGLARLSGPTLDFLQFSQVAGVSLEDIAYGQPFSFGTVAASLVYQGIPPIANPQATDTPIAAWNLVINAAFATQLGGLGLSLPDMLEKADAGFSVNYIQLHLGEYDAYSGALDAGLRLPLDEGIELGIALLNLGKSVTFISAADPLPESASVGVSRGFPALWGNQINVAADYDYPFQDTSSLRFGVEDWIAKSIALRVGYVLYNQQNLGGLSAGLGVQLVQSGLVFHLDYAVLPLYYQGFSSFEAQQQFEMGLTF